MKHVYIAGPFSGKTRADVEANIERAARVGLEVARLGAMPWIPQANTSLPEFEDVQPYEFWIEGTLEQMKRCDAVLMTPDWKRSKGATNEHKVALELGIPVFYDLAQLYAWLLTDARSTGLDAEDTTALIDEVMRRSA
jgi:nucleoside 2-deoxyribosyltransferase